MSNNGAVPQKGPDKGSHNYKLLVDPALKKGQQKLYRVDGVIPGDPTSRVVVTDPRSRVARLYMKNKQAELIIPQFKVDEYYVGIPPPREVTFVNLNDNINSEFLRSMISPLGKIDECSVCYHPQTNKHLGIAKVVFETTRAAKLCVEKYNQTSKMGMTMTVFTDPLGKERQGYIDEKVYGIPRRQTDYIHNDYPLEVNAQPTIIPIDDPSTQHTPHIPMNPEGFDESNGSESATFHRAHPEEHKQFGNDGHYSDQSPSQYNGEWERRESRDMRNSGDHIRDRGRYDKRTRPAYDDYRKRDHSRERRRDWGREDRYWDDSRDDRRSDMRRDTDRDRDSYHDRGRSHHDDRGRGRRRDDRGWGDRGRDRRDSDYSHDSRDRGRRNSEYSRDLDKSNRERSRKERERRKDPDYDRSVSDAEIRPEEGTEEGAADAGALDLDSRIQMMLNQSKALVGFGSPEHVPSVPPPPHPPAAAPMEPVPGYLPEGFAPPHVDAAYPPPMMPPYSMPPPGVPLPGVPPPTIPPPGIPPPGLPPPMMVPGPDGHVIPVPPPAMPPPGWQYPYDEVFHNYLNDPNYQEYPSPEEEPVDYDKAFEDSVDELVDDLKSVMSKDLCKKMFTQSAFKFLDNWWNEEQNWQKVVDTPNYTPVDPDKESSNSQLVNAPPTSKPIAPAITSFSSMFDNASGNIFGTGSFLGMKAGLPKMPSFRKKVSPTRELELKRQKEARERARQRDDEEEEGEIVEKKKSVKRPVRRGSVSTQSSSSSSESSSSDNEAASEDEEYQPKGSGSGSSDSSGSSGSSSSSSSDSGSSSEESASEEETKASSSKKTVLTKKAEVSSSSESEPEVEETKRKVKLPKWKKKGQLPIIPVVDKTKAQVVGKKTPEKEKVKATGASTAEDEGMNTESSPETAVETATETAQETAAETADETAAEEEREEVEIEMEKEGVPDMHVYIEHNYCRPASEAPEPKPKAKRTYNTKKKQLQEITNKIPTEKGARELDNLLKAFPDDQPVKAKSAQAKFARRDPTAERAFVYDFFKTGLDAEDLKYTRICYEKMLNEEDTLYDWCNDTHWVEHSITNIPDPDSGPANKKRKKDTSGSSHKSGSARTEGYYKLSNLEKSKFATNARQFAQKVMETKPVQDPKKVSVQNLLREARSNQRRLATAFGDLDTGELLKFNQLKFRKKALRFSRSHIHDWGLYALEPIPADTMVIEYVGAILRHSVADEKEKQYERIGIGSSYLFRIDGETVIDATKCGNMARFVNHSCDPNCYARVITVDTEKKIVIYSRRKIDMNEEITYDYKFPYEDEKITCLCGAPTCRGFLN